MKKLYTPKSRGKLSDPILKALLNLKRFLSALNKNLKLFADAINEQSYFCKKCMIDSGHLQEKSRKIGT